jgi:hypothetical protein
MAQRIGCGRCFQTESNLRRKFKATRVCSYGARYFFPSWLNSISPHFTFTSGMA